MSSDRKSKNNTKHKRQNFDHLHVYVVDSINVCGDCRGPTVQGNALVKNRNVYVFALKQNNDNISRYIAEKNSIHTSKQSDAKMSKNELKATEKRPELERKIKLMLQKHGASINHVHYRECLNAFSYNGLEKICAIALVKDLAGNCVLYFLVKRDNTCSDYGFCKVISIYSNTGTALVEQLFNDNKKSIMINGFSHKLVDCLILKRALCRSALPRRIYSINKLDKTQNKKNETDAYTVVYVYFGLNNRCMRHKHIIESVTAETINAKNGQSVEINVHHCKTCNKYFINYEALQTYIRREIFPVLTYSLEDYDQNGLRVASELMLYGYNVREGGLTREQRQKILSWIIDSGLLSKSSIIRDLQFKVNYNGRKKGNANAKKKWQDDIQFVSQYVKGNSTKIKARFIRK